MSRPDAGRWQRVSPLSVLFYIGQVLRGIARNLFQTVVPAAVFLISTDWTTEDRLYTLAAALALLLILVSTARYLRFRFRIEEDGIRIRQGIFRREELDIGFDRIQGVNTTQNPLYRFFDLVDVRLDTAGSAAAEGHLPAVRSNLGETLQRRVRRRRKEAPGGVSAASSDDADGAEERVLLRLSAGDTVRIGLYTGRGLLLLAFLVPLAEQLDEGIGERLEAVFAPFFAAVTGLSPTGTALAVAALFLGAASLLILLSVIAAFLRHHGYTLTTDGELIRSRGGFLTTREHSMGLTKLQLLEIRQSPLLRLFSGFRILAKQAASHAVNTRKSFLIPLAGREFLGEARAVFFDGEGRSLDLRPEYNPFHAIAARYIRSRTLLVGGGAATVVFLNLAIRGHWVMATLLPPLAVLIAWLVVRRRHERWGLALTGDAAIVRRGLVGTTWTVFLLRKVQRVDIVQSPFQRRHGLVTVSFVLAADTVTVPWIDEQVAKRLCDWVLYRVESSRLAWL